MGCWYTRPVFFVADVDAALEFYGRMDFAEAWRFAEDAAPSMPAPTERTGPTVVAQVQRETCEILLSRQWPDKVGAGMLFTALTAEDWAALPQTFEARGVAFEQGWWGYRSLIVTDPHGNQLYFPDPDDSGGGG